ncbi:CASP-like protein 4C2 [Quercus suber]|uniref:CASP-like protein n=1 Tax=Quercus suber TaxID=58331 RepID=A0AAW0LWN9_QUESU|nr:CASP-like protein 4C2 [Quercus suber]XP_023914762.1 CASP-like protein 4C2 isoform X1 [Quercus suber]XP_023914763.1 CASP-like protein 4C2 isoform X2 [Quercus suber]POE70791.1 casp-like protein 4c2 [Quercus suber]
MRSPQALLNGENPSPHRRNSNFSTPLATPHHPASHFQSTVTVHKLRRFNSLILLFRIAAFCFSLTSFVFMITTNSRSSSSSPHWYDFDAFRFVLAANAIVAVYSLFEMVASVWEISRDTTLFPESLQVWFDFGHDQVFAYLLLSANSAGTEMARTLRNTNTCTATNAFCVQSDISIALGFAGFLFLGFSSLLSGFRVVCFIINGSRFHL